MAVRLGIDTGQIEVQVDVVVLAVGIHRHPLPRPCQLLGETVEITERVEAHQHARTS